MSPGWSREEAETLKLLLMRHGVGRWVRISDSGLLPGKQIQQLSAQTQRLLGQQSLAAFTGLRVDLDRIRADNEARVDAPRKAGLIVNSGPNPTREIVRLLRGEAEKRYGLTPEALALVEARLDEIARERFLGGPLGRRALEHPVLALDVTKLDDESIERLLAALKQQETRLEATAAALRPGGGVYAAGTAGGGSGGNAGLGGSASASGAHASRASSGEAPLDEIDDRASSGASKAGASGPPPPHGGAQRPAKKGASSGKGKKRPAPEPADADEGPGGSWADDRTSGPFPNASASSDDEEWKPKGGRKATRTKAKKAGKASAAGAGAPRASARRRAAGKGVDELEVALSSLEAMGFTRQMARDAMRECDDDVAAALDWLLAMAGSA